MGLKAFHPYSSDRTLSIDSRIAQYLNPRTTWCAHMSDVARIFTLKYAGGVEHEHGLSSMSLYTHTPK